MSELKENAHYGEPVPCPFCGQDIRVWIGGKCGKEQGGSTSINHYCQTDSGLSIEYFEHGMDGERALKALKARV